MQTEDTKSSAKQQKQKNDKASVPLRGTSGNNKSVNGEAMNDKASVPLKGTSGNKKSVNGEAIVPPRAATSASNNSVSGGLNGSSVPQRGTAGKDDVPLLEDIKPIVVKKVDEKTGVESQTETEVVKHQRVSRPLPTIGIDDESHDGQLSKALTSLLATEYLSEHIPLFQKHKFMTVKRLGLIDHEDLQDWKLASGDRKTILSLALNAASVLRSSDNMQGLNFSPSLSVTSGSVRSSLASTSSVSERAKSGAAAFQNPKCIQTLVFGSPQREKTKRKQRGRSIAEHYFTVNGKLLLQFPSDRFFNCFICNPDKAYDRPMTSHCDIRRHGDLKTHQEHLRKLLNPKCKKRRLPVSSFFEASSPKRPAVANKLDGKSSASVEASAATAVVGKPVATRVDTEIKPSEDIVMLRLKVQLAELESKKKGNGDTLELLRLKIELETREQDERGRMSEATKGVVCKHVEGLPVDSSSESN